MRTYFVKEVFDSIQGEGRRAGTRAVFVRFAGCNLWSGIEAGRTASRAACARWCDTDFVGGKALTAAEIVDLADTAWPMTGVDARWCVLTGGEPLLQVDEDLLNAFRRRGWRVAVETNGTVDSSALDLVDWTCVSPKRGAQPSLQRADELKVVLACEEDEAMALDLSTSGSWKYRYVQPCDGPNAKASAKRCVRFVREHPEWILGVQLHKILGLR